MKETSSREGTSRKRAARKQEVTLSRPWSWTSSLMVLKPPGLGHSALAAGKDPDNAVLFKNTKASERAPAGLGPQTNSGKGFWKFLCFLTGDSEKIKPEAAQKREEAGKSSEREGTSE